MNLGLIHQETFWWW